MDNADLVRQDVRCDGYGMYMVLVGIVVGEVQYFKDTMLSSYRCRCFMDSIHSRWVKESIRELEVSLEGVAMAALFIFERDRLKTYQWRR